MIKPDRIHVSLPLPHALDPLCKIDNWVVWHWKERRAKYGSVQWTESTYCGPVPTRQAKNNDPKTWCSHKTAADSLEYADGIGFVLLDTSFDVVDLDHCRNPDTGEIDAWAQAWIENGAYVELTPS